MLSAAPAITATATTLAALAALATSPATPLAALPLAALLGAAGVAAGRQGCAAGWGPGAPLATAVPARHAARRHVRRVVRRGLALARRPWRVASSAAVVVLLVLRRACLRLQVLRVHVPRLRVPVRHRVSRLDAHAAVLGTAAAAATAPAAAPATAATPTPAPGPWVLPQLASVATTTALTPTAPATATTTAAAAAVRATRRHARLQRQYLSHVLNRRRVNRGATVAPAVPSVPPLVRHEDGVVEGASDAAAEHANVLHELRRHAEAQPVVHVEGVERGGLATRRTEA